MYIMRRLKIVKFNNGKYAVRRETGILFKDYRYFNAFNKDYIYWEDFEGRRFMDCQSTYEEAVENLIRITDYGVPV